MPKQLTQQIGSLLFVAGFILFTLPGGFALYLYLSSPDEKDITISTTPNLMLPPASANGSNSLYPGHHLPVRQWANPRETFPLPQLSGDPFAPLNSKTQPVIHGSEGRALFLQIPELSLAAEVIELELANLGQSLEYETPKFTVGHIPATPNPGSRGSGWYFGHLDNPIGGEGNVFSKLPQIAEMLKTGDDVHIVLATDRYEYLYSAYKTSLIKESDLQLTNSNNAEVVLVTCFPRLTYEKRLLVHAELIGVRKKI